jgi:hypothetical protein
MAMEPKVSESVARLIFETAIAENRASDLLHCLFNGGTATVDVETHKLVLMTGDMLQALLHDDTLI